MATKPRIYSHAGLYHVYNRGSRHQNVFLEERDRQLFLELLASLVRKGTVRCHASCLMGNHYHLLLEAEGLQISMAMKELMGQYVQKFNARHGFDGPLFRSRFASTAIEDDEHLLETVRYIHNNPVDIGWSPDRYPWSSHRFYLGVSPKPRWLESAQVLSYFGDDISAYQSFVEGTPYRVAI